MKLFVSALVAFLSLCNVAKAQEVALQDGSRLFRIEVDERDRGNTNERIRRLERAVRQLQNRVFELEATGVNPETWSCVVVKNFPVKRHYGQPQATRMQAERSALDECERNEINDAMCTPDWSKMACERS